jgi:hypothetical protein
MKHKVIVGLPQWRLNGPCNILVADKASPQEIV